MNSLNDEIILREARIVYARLSHPSQIGRKTRIEQHELKAIADVIKLADKEYD